MSENNGSTEQESSATSSRLEEAIRILNLYNLESNIDRRKCKALFEKELLSMIKLFESTFSVAITAIEIDFLEENNIKRTSKVISNWEIV